MGNSIVEMKKCLYILFLLFLPLAANADVEVVLRSGQTSVGSVVFQNSEVVVIKTAEGTRFQYPMSEVMSIKEVEAEEKVEIKEENTRESGGKKVGFSLHVSGGAGLQPKYNAGGSFAAELYIGACNLLGRHVFVGGGIGYDSYLMPSLLTDDTPPIPIQDPLTYSFIPIKLRFSAPILQGKHAPAAGLSIGYGFSLGGIKKGGLATDIDFGYRYQISARSAVFAGVTAALQQAKQEFVEIIEGDRFEHTEKSNLWKVGAKVAIQF